MANEAWASGHILCFEQSGTNDILRKISKLPDEPYKGPFSIWKGIFHAPAESNKAGLIITFGLSHQYLGEASEIGDFLTFWEDLICDVKACEVFIALEQEFIYSDQPFGKFYFNWQWESYPKSHDGRWVFRGTTPIDQQWKSRFETNLENT